MRGKVGFIAVLAAASAAALSGAAIAQDTGATPEVKVQASRVITKQVGKSASTGAPIETAEITMRVSYADLSLDTNSGQALLKDRVLTAAKDACARISPLGKVSDTTDADCVRTAMSGAQPQVDAAIAQANARR